MTYNTEKRTELLGFLESNADTAFSIEEICARLTADGKGKSTLYRQMAKLVEEGYVSRIPTGSRRFVYQYRDKQHCGEHLHLKCLDCGRLLHLNAEASASLGRDLLSREGFLLKIDLRNLRTGFSSVPISSILSFNSILLFISFPPYSTI